MKPARNDNTVFRSKKIITPIVIFLIAIAAIYFLGKYSESHSRYITYTEQTTPAVTINNAYP